ncbi:hypothetical protein DOTSEDRAFT_32823 [Dothistroma septosporum NZE10]|uniref:Uncharacterized protein n=1 Tax=Dothistroma septosporum (strain NZE10 / CBS 128990) TaxID=675120 RepID=N1PUY1_DOTSN|nr:hypothetical protein DOTSEDRAFT_32823 [Dothistroma septosporum NZE10]
MSKLPSSKLLASASTTRCCRRYHDADLAGPRVDGIGRKRDDRPASHLCTPQWLAEQTSLVPARSPTSRVMACEFIKKFAVCMPAVETFLNGKPNYAASYWSVATSICDEISVPLKASGPIFKAARHRSAFHGIATAVAMEVPTTSVAHASRSAVSTGVAKMALQYQDVDAHGNR